MIPLGILGAATTRAGGGGATAFRYWRLYDLKPQSGTWVALQEIEFRGEPGGPDLTSPAEAVARAFESAHYDVTSCDKAFDNNLTNYVRNAWVTGGGFPPPHFIGWDFVAPTSVAEVALLQQAYSEGSNRGPKEFLVQGSNDKISWETIKSFTSVTGWTLGVWKVFSLL